MFSLPFYQFNICNSNKMKAVLSFYSGFSFLSLFNLLDGHLKLFIKNMVCIRCQMVVKSELEKLGLHYNYVKIGEADIVEDMLPEQLEKFNTGLKKAGLILMDDKKSILVEKIKSVIIELVHFTDEQIKVNLSDFLSEKLEYDYTYIANLFSEMNGVTIEKFYLTHKIERVKELIVYGDLNLSEIAWNMHYSSVAHLSNQFKKFTGMTPTQFKMLKNKSQDSLNDV